MANSLGSPNVDIFLGGVEVPDSDFQSYVVDRDMFQPDMAAIVLSNKSHIYSKKKPGDAVEIKVNGTSIYKGEIVGLEATYKGGDKTRILIRAMNKMHLLVRKRKSMTFANQSDEQILNHIANDAGLSLEWKHDKSITHKHVYQHNQTDLEFLRTRAARMGCHVWCVDSKLYVQQPDLSDSLGIKLTVDEAGADNQLRSFTPRMSSASVFKKVTVKGWNPETKQLITGNASAQNSPLGAQNAVSGSGNHGSEENFTVDHPIWSKEEADALAQGRLTDLSLQYMTGEAEVTGNPKFELGKTVEIVANAQDRSDPFNGKYYIMGVTHRHTVTQGGDGYVTTLRLARDAQRAEESNGAAVVQGISNGAVVMGAGGIRTRRSEEPTQPKPPETPPAKEPEGTWGANAMAVGAAIGTAAVGAVTGMAVSSLLSGDKSVNLSPTGGNISAGGMGVDASGGGLGLHSGGSSLIGSTSGLKVSGGGLDLDASAGGAKMSAGGVGLDGSKSGLGVSAGDMDVSGGAGGGKLSAGGVDVGGSASGANVSAAGVDVGGSKDGGSLSGGGASVGGSASGANISGGGVTAGGSKDGGNLSGGGASVGGSASGANVSGGGASVGGSASGANVSGGGVTAGGSKDGGSLSGSGGSVGGSASGANVSGGGVTAGGSKDGGSLGGGGASVGGSAKGANVSGGGVSAGGSAKGGNVAGGGANVGGSATGASVKGGGVDASGSAKGGSVESGGASAGGSASGAKVSGDGATAGGSAKGGSVRATETAPKGKRGAAKGPAKPHDPGDEGSGGTEND